MSKVKAKASIIPWYFVMFFSVIVVVDSIMVTLAIRTQSGVVTDHAYEKGIAYNKIIEASEKQEKSGISGDIEVHGSKFTLKLKDKDANIISPENAYVDFSSPVRGDMDFSIKLANGEADVEFPAKGQWEARATASYKNEDYRFSKRLVIK